VPRPALHSALVHPLAERCLDVCEQRFELELSEAEKDGGVVE